MVPRVLLADGFGDESGLKESQFLTEDEVEAILLALQHSSGEAEISEGDVEEWAKKMPLPRGFRGIDSDDSSDDEELIEYDDEDEEGEDEVNSLAGNTLEGGDELGPARMEDFEGKWGDEELDAVIENLTSLKFHGLTPGQTVGPEDVGQEEGEKGEGGAQEGADAAREDGGEEVESWLDKGKGQEKDKAAQAEGDEMEN